MFGVLVDDLVFDGTGAGYPQFRDAPVENYSIFFLFSAFRFFGGGAFQLGQRDYPA